MFLRRVHIKEHRSETIFLLCLLLVRCFLISTEGGSFKKTKSNRKKQKPRKKTRTKKLKGGNVNSTLTIDCEKLPNTSGRTTRYPMKYEGEIIFIRDMIASSGDPVKDLYQDFQDNK